MLRKLWRRLRRQDRGGTKMIGPAETGKTMTIQGRPGESQLRPTVADWYPVLLHGFAELAARRGWQPIVFVDEVGLEEIPLPARENAPQE